MKTIGTKSEVVFRQRNLQLSLQLNANISGYFGPSEQLFPETNRWVPLIYRILLIQKGNFTMAIALNLISPTQYNRKITPCRSLLT